MVFLLYLTFLVRQSLLVPDYVRNKAKKMQKKVFSGLHPYIWGYRLSFVDADCLLKLRVSLVTGLVYRELYTRVDRLLT